MDHLLALVGLDPNRVILGNPLSDWLFAMGLGLLSFATLLFVRFQLASRTRRLAGSELPRGLALLLTLLRKTQVLPLLALSLAAGSKYLELPTRAEKLTTGFIAVMVALQAGIWASAALRFAFEEHSAQSIDRGSQSTVTIAQFVANVAIWSLLLLLALDNLGFQLKTLLAGLGIGGIAVALALQNVLGDVFASVSIALDKPFLVGDALMLDSGYVGTVEAIGIKSTRLRSVGGEQIVVPNAEFVKARIRNFGRIAERRSVFRFGLAQKTRAGDLAAVPELVRAAVSAQPSTRFERAHFVTIGSHALEFELAFVVASADYVQFLDVQQAVNLAITAELERRGIEFASPPLVR